MSKFTAIKPTGSMNNAIVRFEGTNGNILKGGENAPAYDDSGNVTLVSGATIDGRDPSVDGVALDAAVAAVALRQSATLTQRVIAATTGALVLADFPATGAKLLLVGHASPVAFTVPDNADVALPLNMPIKLIATNAGQITVTEDTAVTVTPTPGFTLVMAAGAGAQATLIQTATDQWYLSGDLVASV
jgi:hypothetical protein